MNTIIGFIIGFSIFIFAFMYRLRTYEKPLEEETPEVYPYKYKTPFDDKLIELGVKEKWDSNWTSSPNSGCFLFESENFYIFIMNSFCFDNTPEGYEFWLEISKK